jgi:hypothetical protein
MSVDHSFGFYVGVAEKVAHCLVYLLAYELVSCEVMEGVN